MNSDKNCDCDGFTNAFWGALAFIGLVVHPFLSIIAVILWAVATASGERPARPPTPLLSADQIQAEAERAAARLAREAERARRQRRAAVAFAAIVAAVIAAEVIAIWVGWFSHLNPSDVFPWIVSGGILAFVVVWAKFYRQEVA